MSWLMTIIFQVETHEEWKNSICELCLFLQNQVNKIQIGKKSCDAMKQLILKISTKESHLSDAVCMFRTNCMDAKTTFP